MTSDKTREEQAAEIGKCAMSAIREMVEALECDYERLEELRELWADANQAIGDDFTQIDADELAELEAAAGECASREDAEQRIMDDPLSLQFRSGWSTSRDELEPEEFELLLSTGGPAVRIIGDIDRGEASNPKLEVQDWFKPWTEYNTTSDDDAALEAYCRCFCFE